MDLKKNQNKLLSDKESTVILTMSGPMAVGILVLFLFNFVDTLFISMLGTKPLAAISFTFPISFTVTSVAIGLTTGMATNIGFLIGQDQQQAAKHFVTDGVCLSFLLIAMLAFSIGLWMEPLFVTLGAQTELLPFIREYMHILLFALPILVIPMVSNGAMRAQGDTRTPSLIMIGAGCINGILDPLLIFGLGPFPALGMRGAALASGFAWFAAAVYALYVLFKQKQLLALSLSPLKTMLQHWRHLLHVGVPAGATNLLTPLSTTFITYVLASYGSTVVAGYGAAARIESIIMIAVMAVSSVLAPFIAQNVSAGFLPRALRGFRFTLVASFLFETALYIPLWFLAPHIASWFSNDEAVIVFMTSYFHIVALSYGFVAVMILNIAAFNGIRASFFAFMMDASRLFLFLLPFVYLGSAMFNEVGVLFGICVTNMVTGSFALWLGHRFFLPLARRGV